MNFLLIILIISVIVLTSSFIVYFLIIVYIHDFGIKTFGKDFFVSNGYKKILFTFPHPDDETMISGGLINKLSKDTNFDITILSITKGEKGDELLKLLPNELATIREKEYFDAMNILAPNAKHLLWDIGDGEVSRKYEKTKNKLKDLLSKENYDLVVTYEKMGIYGHQDHVAQSKMINEISEESKVNVIYATLGKKVQEISNIQAHIKNLDLDISDTVRDPEFKVNIFANMFSKYKSAKAYRSQNLSHDRPLWVTIFSLPFEYYTTKYDNRA